MDGNVDRAAKNSDLICERCTCKFMKTTQSRITVST
jgi:hypothetical protein